MSDQPPTPEEIPAVPTPEEIEAEHRRIAVEFLEKSERQKFDHMADVVLPAALKYAKDNGLLLTEFKTVTPAIMLTWTIRALKELVNARNARESEDIQKPKSVSKRPPRTRTPAPPAESTSEKPQ